MNVRELIERAHADGVDLSIDGDQVRFKATLGPVKSDMLAELKARKAAVLSLLRSLPTYTHDQQFELSAWYVAQDRATRLRIMRRKNAMKTEDGIPEHIALPLAIDSEMRDFNPRMRN